MLRQLVNFLLGNHDGVLEVEAGEVHVLKGVVLVIHLIKNLPGYVELDSLLHHFHLVFVLVLEVRTFLELH